MLSPLSSSLENPQPFSKTKHLYFYGKQLDNTDYTFREGFPGSTVVKNPPADAGNVRDTSLILGLERSPGGGNDNPLQYSCLDFHGQRSLAG